MQDRLTVDERERRIAQARVFFTSLGSVAGIDPDQLTDYFARDLDREPQTLSPEIWMADGFVRDNA